MNRPINEQDEFLLSRLVDDDLPLEEADALRGRLDREPELQEIYHRMTRLDALLAARRGDQPAVDWGRFHRQVMAQVAGESRSARPAVYKLRDYLRLALPLSAAAAIALVIGLYSREGASPKMVGPVPGNVARHLPDPQESAEVLIVRYARSTRVETDDDESRVEIRYVRSDELLEETRNTDNVNRNRGSYGAILASAELAPAPAAVRPEVLAAIASSLSY